ncbi:ABC transporter ATP-binding protein [Azospirillum rugosum]|uniref:Simple sugar transport system ATP-binding protein n=1 Tax=Azospirillum rugosum TaxID=416170 RepID=A0ABS4SJK1_9PROT|nr:ABC transporter ATP-binding protein [Azospirillum rugosum]MBP2292741.1 simple sugar transport system ATP-binding protein [Azospirillum rugosum]MDQ0527000.1 simple sugar transport system ATP-binding protein [Azospirillum rugosum]
MPSPPVVLRLSGITKRFGPLVANDAISLTLHEGEVLALLGENGAGKTTLMNILFGHYVADEGSIEAFGRPLPPGSPKAALAAGIGMVHQHFTLADNLSVLDNIAVGTEPLWRFWSDRGAARRRLLDLAERFGLGVRPDALVGDLSVGERQRVEILKALYRDARVLILDEPTAVLTPQESAGLFDTLRRLTADGLAVVFISHKMNEVFAASDTVAVLRAGRLVATRRTAETDREELAELMVGRALKPPTPTPMAAGEPVLALAQVTVNSGHGRPLLDAVDLTVRRHQVIGIAGVSGNGQTALADLVSGLIHPDSGTLSLKGETVGYADPAAMVRRGVARIPEDRHAAGLVGAMAVWENLIAERYHDPAFQRFGVIRRGAARAHARAVIEAFDVRCPGPDARTQLLSGGNMQKLILGRTLAHGPDLILASQPTRGLDVGAVSYVHGRLLEARAAGAGVLVISEDLDEILALADAIAVIHHGRLTPALPHDRVSVRQLGLLMAGHWDVLPEILDAA